MKLLIVPAPRGCIILVVFAGKYSTRTFANSLDTAALSRSKSKKLGVSRLL